MSSIGNPFLKDYSSISLLKRNYGVLQINSQIKENKPIIKNQYQNDKQNMSGSKISNPFAKKSLNSFQMSKQKATLRQFGSGDTKFHSQASRPMFNSLEKNVFYKGLEEVGTRQLWKSQFQKEARYKLKNYGPDSMRYQYKPFQNYKQNQNVPEKTFPINKQKFVYSQKQYGGNHISSFNQKAISEYYGYENSKKSQDDFVIQKKDIKKSSFKQPKIPSYEKLNSDKRSYFEDIPEDKNEDLGTMKKIQKFSDMAEQVDGVKQFESKLSEYRRSSIETFQNKYHNSFQPQSSASSGFGSPSQMYESGANFKTRFSSSKQGPLNALTFDDDKDENVSDAQSSSDKKKQNFPKTLQYNNRIYFNIQL